jgi:hypothetical protein
MFAGAVSSDVGCFFSGEVNMTRWLGQMEVAAACVMPDGTGEFVHKDPRGRFDARLAQRESGVLDLYLILDAPHFEMASKSFVELATEFLASLSFVTHTAFKMTRPMRIIDWSTGIKLRSHYTFYDYASEKPTLPALDQAYGSAVALLSSVEQPLAIVRAMRWFAHGLDERRPEDQFQCFFFAIELVAQFAKGRLKVPDTCPTCNGALYCRTCEKTPMHRPFAAQAIEQLIARVRPHDSTSAYKALSTARHALMHGRLVEDFRDDLLTSWSDVVDLAGHVAWEAIVKYSKLPPGDEHSIAVSHVRSFVSEHYRLTLHATFACDENEPRIEDQPSVSIKAR